MSNVKKLGFVGTVAAGLTTALLGLASPAAHADYGHNQWITEMGHSAVSSHVDTGVSH